MPASSFQPRCNLADQLLARVGAAFARAATAAATMDPPKPASLLFTPKQIYDINVAVGVAKNNTPWPRLALMGLMCGGSAPVGAALPARAARPAGCCNQRAAQLA